MPTRDLDAVLATDELDRRPSRSPDYAAENAALRELMEVSARDPEAVLQRLVEVAMARCGGDAATFSMRTDASELRWEATAGGFADHRGESLNPEETPGSVAIEQGATQLFVRPGRRWPRLRERGAEVTEALISPFFVEGRPLGALWVARYDERPFDAEDRRMLESLAEFAGLAWRLHEDRRVAQAGEEKLRLITDRLPVRVAYIDQEFRLRFMNDAYERVAGVTRAEMLGKTVAEGLGDAVFGTVKGNLERALDGETFSREFEAPYPQGARQVQVTYVPDVAPDGGVRGVVVQAHDVTERREADLALRTSEARFRTLFDSIDEGFVIIEMIFDEAGKPLDYRFREFNDAFIRLTGIPADWARNGVSAREAVPGLEEFWFETYGRVAQTGESMRFENEAAPMGKWFDVHAFRIGGEGSVEVGVLFADITARRRQEAAFEEARLRLDDTLNTAEVATFDWDAKEDRVYGNALLPRFFGVPNSPEGNPLALYYAALHPDDVAGLGTAIEGSFASGEPYEAQYRVRGEKGQERWVLARGVAVRGEDGEPARLYGVVVDISARVASEEALHASVAQLAVEQGRLQALFQLSPSAIAVIRGDDLRFEYANNAYLRLAQREDIVGKTLLEALPDIKGQGFDDLLRQVMATGEPFAMVEAPVVLRPDANAPPQTIYINHLYQPMREADGSTSGVFVHAVDVTDQVVTRKAIAEREELFRTVFEQAPDDAILVMALDRTLTAWNPAAVRVTGWTAEEAVGQPADVIFSPGDRASGVPERETGGAARDGKAADERWHMRKDGSRFWGSGTMNALHDAEGNVNGYLKVFRDATARYQETRTLDFLRRLTETVIEKRDPDAIIETGQRMLGEYLGATRVLFAEADADGMVVNVRQDWTNGVVSIVGAIRVADFGPKAMADLQAGRAHVSRDNERDYAPGEGLEATRAIGVRANVSLPVLKNGRLAAVIAVHQGTPRDWTEDEVGLIRQVADRVMAEIERARAEAQVRASEERFRGVVELSPSTVWTAEPKGGLTYISQDFYDTTGLTPETSLPYGWAATVHPDDLARVVAQWEAARRDETLYDTEFRIRHGNGEYRWISARALPVRDANGRVTSWIGSNSDIQDRKEAEESLQRAVEERTVELQQAVQEAEGFNYSISHDLRAPVRAISSTASILLDEIGPDLDPEYRLMLERQTFNAKRLGTLIDELLRLSRYARVEVARQALDMTEKARSIAEEAGSDCRVEVQEDMTAQGDPGLVRTILENLIGNACKFSPAGGTVWVEQRGEVFSVRDEGVGFDMAYAHKVFMPFERLVTEAEFPGTGIGLANVKRIVERHGGKVWAESEPGQGATFSFTLG